MSWRKSHGTGASTQVVQIEVRPADELQEPVPVPAKLELRGGATKIRLIRYAPLPDTDEWRDLAKMAEAFAKHHMRELAKMSGGRCGAAPSSMITSASLQLASSRYLFNKGAAEGDPSLLKMASSIANDSRQNLLASYELAVREAHARKTYTKADPHRALEDALDSEDKPSS